MLIGERVVDFLLVLIELFSLFVTGEALRANIDGFKIGDVGPTGASCPVPTFPVEWVAPTGHRPPPLLASD